MSEYRSIYYGLLLNETIRTNHDTCGDTRGRLYFTAKHGRIVAYCHNCFSSGATRRSTYKTTSPVRTDKIDVGVPPPIPAWTIPPSSTVISIPWAREPILEAALVTYDADASRWIIPVGNALDLPNKKVIDYQGYIARKISGSPKYTTHVQGDFRGYMYYLPNDPGDDNPDIKYVIVEDQMSACAIAMAGHVGVAMFGAKHNLEKIHNICQDGGESTRDFVVWYDNDNAQVIQSAKTTKEYLCFMNANVRLVTIKNEPKNMSLQDILEVIR